MSSRVLETVEDSLLEETLSDSQMEDGSEYELDDEQPKPFIHAKLNNLFIDLNSPKTSAVILGYRLKSKTYALHEYHFCLLLPKQLKIARVVSVQKIGDRWETT